jgi:hypothetical protein
MLNCLGIFSPFSSTADTDRLGPHREGDGLHN